MMKLIVALTLLLAVTNVSGNFWRDCGDGTPAPNWVTSPFCDAVRCTVTRGGTLLGQAQHTSPRSYSQLIIRFTAFVLGIPVVIPNTPGNENACTQLADGVTCPTPANTPIVWNINLPIPTTVPALNNAPVRIELSEGGTSVVCAMVTAIIL
ncbi:CLUMA_CG017681, isoform A [Clunio marinus]|uniref:CLUMA_CG017681, isoform A n=1 Tax=Clunio marinus TaxID=568069 RepID=A0A1J1IWM4_9DIPT|nr:CLUMA_CG017681, isoform A [Clunio marinus]